MISHAKKMTHALCYVVHTCNTQLFRMCFFYTLTNSRHLLEYPVMCVANLNLKLWPICEEIFLHYNKKSCRSTGPTYILHIKILVSSFLLFSYPQRILLSSLLSQPSLDRPPPPLPSFATARARSAGARAVSTRTRPRALMSLLFTCSTLLQLARSPCMWRPWHRR